MANRPTLYTRPNLIPVADNGGNRINKKLLQLLKSFEAQHELHGTVDELIKANKGKKASGTPPPSKATSKPKASPKVGKKRVKQESEEGSDEASPSKKSKIKATAIRSSSEGDIKAEAEDTE